MNISLQLIEPTNEIQNLHRDHESKQMDVMMHPTEIDAIIFLTTDNIIVVVFELTVEWLVFFSYSPTTLQMASQNKPER